MWLTYHLSPREQVQVSWRDAKAPLDFIPGGTTQRVFQVSGVKRVRSSVEVKGNVQYERWAAPIYQPGNHSDVSVMGQVTWYPKSAR